MLKYNSFTLCDNSFFVRNKEKIENIEICNKLTVFLFYEKY